MTANKDAISEMQDRYAEVTGAIDLINRAISWPTLGCQKKQLTTALRNLKCAREGILDALALLESPHVPANVCTED